MTDRPPVGIKTAKRVEGTNHHFGGGLEDRCILDKPWFAYYGDVPQHIDYPEVTLYEALALTAERCRRRWPMIFFGRRLTYRQFVADIDRCADALAALGMRAGDRMTIAMPTCPQAVIGFYAVNKLGGVASMIHPLSTATEIAFYLALSRSRFALTLDAFYGKFKSILDDSPVEKLVLARIPDYLGWLKGIGFQLTKGRKIPKVPADPAVVWWRTLMGSPHPRVGKGPARFRGSGRHSLQRRHHRQAQGHHAVQPEFHLRRHAGLGLGAI